MADPNFPFCLSVDALEIPLHLGVGEAERAELQTVQVWIHLFYAAPPEGAKEDMAAYCCYDSLCQALIAKAKEQPYHLIEYLCADFFRVLREQIPAEVKLWIKVQKALPISLVGYVVKGASATYTDLPGGVRP